LETKRKRTMQSILNFQRVNAEKNPWDEDSPDTIFKRCEEISAKYHSNFKEYSDMMDRFTFSKKMIAIFSSNKIEGSKISYGDTMRIIKDFAAQGDEAIREILKKEEKQKVSGNPPAKREVLQHYLALKHLLEQKDLPLTEEIIKETHQILMDGLLDDDGLDIVPGTYRTENISAKEYVFLDPKHVSSFMQSFVSDFNTFSDQADMYLFAGWTCAQFVTIHPFNDGNGRMSRLLFNYALQKKGVPFYVPIGVENGETSHYLQILRRYQRSQMNKHNQYNRLITWAASLVLDGWTNFEVNMTKD